ncbi:hut operon transcriptional regulator HutP [Geobacillus sp. DSP4a]|uniref:hut operon transcriptional regulator HutP n=1 Tax=Geobacillus sp. DSP4a TaxID=2508873 RepID=UPI00067D453D|nr:hut operon transcriptional regulator HutP [Geobacillus sp. DSP4a]AKU27095.1 Hut operon positive regulatory protein [Geobacillus sp. LC300]NNV00676.1 anti-terminator HutP [Geobacillus sp. DSP4a]QOR84677.1 hut operon transcriptional regulator HutP [Geobacillus stearothermophilus]
MEPRQARIGRQALLLAMLDEGEEEAALGQLEALAWRYCQGRVGAMEPQKIVAAIETAAKRHGVVDGGLYREMHALYHAILEAVHGVTRGQVELGDLLRTAGLRFAVVRGMPYEQPNEGEWIAVALYGTIGAPVRGLEHEAVGLGINHI